MKLAALFALATSSAALAQSPRDTTRKAVSPTDTTDSTVSASVWTTGVATGQLRFSDGGEERAIAASLSAHLWGWLDVAVSPTYAWATSGSSQTTATTVLKQRTVSGLTALPVDIGISHNLPGAWSPSLALSLGITLPTGDTSKVGSDQTALGTTLGVSVAPSDNVSFNASVGRTLTNSYSVGLGNSSPTSLSAGATFQLGSVGVSATYATDVGTATDGFEPARSLAGGISVPIHGDLAMSLDGTAGLTNGAPNWAYSIGFGTAAAGIASATVSPLQRLRRAFGKGRTFTKTKPKTRPSTKKHGKTPVP